MKSRRDFFIGMVINNYDKLQSGKIQIRIQYLHEGINDDTLLPWIKQDSSFTSDIPEVGDLIHCYFIDDYYKNGYYLNKLTLDNYHMHKIFYDVVAPKVGIKSQYPNYKILKYSNGSCIAISSDLNNQEVILFNQKDGF